MGSHLGVHTYVKLSKIHTVIDLKLIEKISAIPNPSSSLSPSIFVPQIHLSAFDDHISINSLFEKL